MAKRAKTKARKRTPKAKGRTVKNTKRRQARPVRRSAKRPTKKAKVKRPQKARKRAAPKPAPSANAPRLNRERRVLTDPSPSVPSSLDMDRYASAARTGRKVLDRNLQEHHGMGPAITGGDVDADMESAYFSGDEAPGGDNPTPDQDNVEEIGQALGVSYEDNEELKGSDKVIARDKHRWELDPASADDYKKNRE